jgi:hypothetical protein
MLSFQREVLARLNLIRRTVSKTLHTHVDNTVHSKLNDASLALDFRNEIQFHRGAIATMMSLQQQSLSSPFLHLHVPKFTDRFIIIFFI